MKGNFRLVIAVLALVVATSCKNNGPIAPGGADAPPAWMTTAGVVSVVPGDAAVTVYWGEAIDYQDPPVEYLVYGDLDPIPWDQVPFVRQTNEPFVFTGLTNSSTYWFGVRCRDSAEPPHIDENSNVLSARPEEAGWAVSFGGTGKDEGRDIAVDGEGDVYVVGEAVVDTDFDPGDGVYDTDAGPAFLSRFSPTGQLVWVGSWGADRANGVAVDPEGRIAVAGYFEGETDFDPGPGESLRASSETYGAYGFYVVGAYTSVFEMNGIFQWVSVVPGTFDAGGGIFKYGVTEKDYYSNAVAFDAGGNVLSGGGSEFSDSYHEFYPDEPNYSVYNYTSTALTRKIDPTGEELWLEEYNPVLMWNMPDPVEWDKSVYVSDLAIIEGGYSYAVGKVDYRAFITLMDSEGSLVRDLVIPFPSEAYSVDTDESGNAYVVGSSSAGPKGRIFLKKYSPEYQLLLDIDWGEQLTGHAAVAVASDGSIYMCGYYLGIADFDPGPGVFEVDAGAGSAYYLLKLASDGKFEWAKTWGDSSGSEPLGPKIAVTDYGAVYILGSFEGTIDLDPGVSVKEHSSNGDSDIFLMKLRSDGVM